MKSVRRFTAMLLAGCLSFLSCIKNEQACFQTNAYDEQALTTAKICVNTVNDIRVSHGLSELAILPVLIDLSEVRAEELTIINDHIRPDGSGALTILHSTGIPYIASSENIAAGRSEPVSVIDQWMESNNHRKTILSDSYTHVGVACYSDPDTQYGYYWCMLFMGVYDGKSPRIFDDQFIPERGLGDVDGTYAINAADAARILDYSASTSSGIDYPVVRAFEAAADVNGDGMINSVDASILLTYSVNKGSGNGGELKDYIW